jgi:hypothetical protein
MSDTVTSILASLLLSYSFLAGFVIAMPAAITAPQADDVEAGLGLLRRAQQAMGGAGKLVAVRNTRHLMEITLQPAAGGYKLTQTSKFVKPNYFRQEQETPFGRIVVYSDGETGWMATPQGTITLSTDVLATVRGVLFRQPTVLMLSDRDASRSIRTIAADRVVISSADGQRVEVEFDLETGLPRQQSYVFVAADGRRIARTETFSDWRDIDGVRFPFKAVQYENGSRMLDINVLEYQVNSSLTPTELSRQ